MTHRTLVTSAGTLINHWHKDQVYGEMSEADKASLQASYLASYPGITPVEYTHLDHTTETLLPSHKYNCWGFTFNPRQCWISSGSDVQNILNDNGTQVFPPNLRVGDVVCYRDSAGEITHTGRIWSLDASGQPALVQSKWGSVGEYLHPPLTVPAGDVWARDCTADDRNPFPPCGAFWLSPDLWCNNSGGTTHEDPVRGQPNQLWVRVRNADTLAASGAQVRVYWSDPTGGMPHWDWHLIGTAPLNAPAGPGTEVVAGPVSWTPGPLEPEHCCLFAILDTGDDYHDPATLDPIVWPFDVSRDNNIIWKNMWIIELPPAPGPRPLLPRSEVTKTLGFTAANVTRARAPIEVRVSLRGIGPEELEEMGVDPAIAQPRPGEPPSRLEAGLQEGRGVRRPGVRLPEQRIPAARRPAVGPPTGRPGLQAEAALPERVWRPVKGRPVLQPGRDLVLTTAAVPPGKLARLELRVGAIAGSQPGDVYRLDLEQKVGGQVTGGGTYIIVIKEGAKS